MYEIVGYEVDLESTYPTFKSHPLQLRDIVLERRY